MLKQNQVTENNIKMLVDAFYAKARADIELGPVFTAAIGESDSFWAPHLEKMYAFWSSIMLTSGRYHGNPLKKHKDLPYFDPALFDRWLTLFAETAGEIYTPDIAALYAEKSRRIAESLKLGLYYCSGRISAAQTGDTA